MIPLIGLHINRLTDASRRQVLATRWRVVKVLGLWDEAFLEEVKAANPGVILVGRNYYGSQDLSDIGGAVGPILGTSPRVRQLIDFWETYNECLTADNAKQFCQYTVAVAKALHAAGLKHCALSLAVGTPGGDNATIKATLNDLWPGVAASDAWSYHSYGAPTMDANSQWYDLRYRKYVALDPRYATKRLILSEAGIDFGELAGQRGGYRVHNISDADYAQQLIDFNAAINADPYVVGAAVYQTGDDTDPAANTDGSQTWGSFCLTDQVVQSLVKGLPPMPTPDYAGATFVPCAPGNFGFPNSGDHGREGNAIAGVVLHGTAGPGAVSWFQDPAAVVSAHYVVDTDGSVTQMVLEDDAAYHCGVVTPNSAYYAESQKVNLNLKFIGIEHVRDVTNTSPITAAQLNASIALIKDIFKRRGVLPLIPHDAIDVGRVCPGPSFPFQQIKDAVSPPPPPVVAPVDPDLAYFGMYGYTPNPKGAIFTYALKPLRQNYLKRKAAGDPLADADNPGPAVDEEHQVGQSGEDKYEVTLTNRVIGVQNVAGTWHVYAAELYKK